MLQTNHAIFSNIQQVLENVNRTLQEINHSILCTQQEISYALENNQLYLLYQPIINIQNGQTVAIEALLRWQHPQYGVIMPSEFIPLAESNGLIGSIGKWVLQEACHQSIAWESTGYPVKVSVNLSAQQINNELVETVRSTIKKSKLPPSRLDLEITERLSISKIKESAKILQHLRNLGVGITIDDFGMGYSSLYYLQELPITTIKVDKSFINSITDNIKNEAIVQAIIRLANELGIAVVAEGVETEEQLTKLRQFGCQQFQGFLFDIPRQYFQTLSTYPGNISLEVGDGQAEF